jgi:hypothetical protein
MACACHQCQRHAVNTGKYVSGTALYLFNPCNRQAWWIHTVHTAGSQQVTHRDVGIGRHKSQLNRIGMDRVFPVRHPTCAGARIQNGRGMVMVRDQGHFAG